MRIFIFTIAAEIHARSLAKFYGQYADRHINLKFMRCVSEQEREIRQSVIVKNKLMSVFNASILLLTFLLLKFLKVDVSSGSYICSLPNPYEKD